MAEPCAKRQKSCTTVTLNNGIEMPLVGLGTWKSPLGKTGAAVQAAVRAGMRMVDCANDYGNEAEIGAALKELISTGVVKREELFIQAKLWNSNHRTEHVLIDLQATLEDLQLDYIDSFVIHWPQAAPANGRNAAICRPPFQNRAGKDSEGATMFPIDDKTGLYCSDNTCHYIETWQAMEALVDKGLVRSIGLSNFNAMQIREVLSVARIKPTVLQNECHPYLQQKDLLDLCAQEGIVFQSYSPLGSRDSPFRKPSDPILLEEPDIVAMAQKYNKTPAQIVVRWHIERGCSAVPKSVTPERIADNINVFDFTLTPEDMAKFHRLNFGWRHCLWPETSVHPDYPFKDELRWDYTPGQAPLNTSKSSLE